MQTYSVKAMFHIVDVILSAQQRRSPARNQSCVESNGGRAPTRLKSIMAGDVCKPIAQQLNILHSIMKRRSSAFQNEVAHYLERHPATQYVDILLTDLNGSFRGKRIPVSGLKNWKRQLLPASVFAMDILGNVVEETGLAGARRTGPRMPAGTRLADAVGRRSRAYRPCC